MTLSMLKRDVLHSLNASGMHVDCSVADGLNSANADVGNAKRAKPSAAITLLLMVFMTFPCVSIASRQRRGRGYKLSDNELL
jgi:hypothetical protein